MDVSDNGIIYGGDVYPPLYPGNWDLYPGITHELVTPGEVSGGDVQETTVSVSCNCCPPDTTLLWDSDISQYGITDGLLLLVLVVLSVQTFLIMRGGKK